MKDKLIKHKRNMDICFLVRDWKMSFGDDGFSFNLFVDCDIVNMGFVNSFFLHEKAVFDIKEIDIDDWEISTTPYKKCFRDNTWVPLLF